MKKLIASALLGLSLALGAAGAAHAEPVPAQAAYGWKLAGRYYSYQAAYKAARYLEYKGYDTYIKKCGGYWCVYYQ
jgi:hypothetical protein